MTVLYILLILLTVIVLLLSIALLTFSRKGSFLSEKEKEFLVFVIDIFNEYGDDLGIQSKEQHKKLVEELEKIKNKHLKKPKSNEKS